MNYLFLSLLRVIKKHGSFSYPFINYALKNLHLSKAQIAWIKSIKYEGMYLYRLAMDEEEKKIIDRFARDYIRYNIKWGMRIAVPDEMKDLIQSFHLKKRPASLGYWALDDEKDRKRLVDVLRRFK